MCAMVYSILLIMSLARAPCFADQNKDLSASALALQTGTSMAERENADKGNADRDDNDYIREIIHAYNGAGRKISTVKYDARGLAYRKEVYHHNDAGQLIEECHYGYDGRLLKKIERDYDVVGNVLEETVSDGNSMVISRSRYRYDASFNRVSWHHYLEGGVPEWIRTYTYNEHNKRKEETWMDADGRLAYRYRYTYDNNGNMTGQDVYGSGGQLKWRYAYDLDQHNRRTAVKWYNEKDRLQWVRTYRYDEDGNRVEQRRYYVFQRLFSRTLRYRIQHRFEYTYDEYGYPSQKRVYDETGRFLYSLVREHDPDGRLTRYTRYKSPGIIEIQYTMTYDDGGRKTGWTWYDGDGNVQWQRKYRYDESGRLTREIWY